MEASYNKKVQIDSDGLKNHCSGFLTGSFVFIKKIAKVSFKMANNSYVNL